MDRGETIHHLRGRIGNIWEKHLGDGEGTGGITRTVLARFGMNIEPLADELINNGMFLAIKKTFISIPKKVRKRERKTFSRHRSRNRPDSADSNTSLFRGP